MSMLRPRPPKLAVAFTLAGGALALACSGAPAQPTTAAAACSEPAPAAAPVAATTEPATPTAAPPAKNGDTTDQSEQTAMTPDQALAALRAGNERFASGKSTLRDYPTQVNVSAKGQYPFATVLSCIDSRSAPELVFDQGIGDLFAPRIAGNFATKELIGSMEFTTQVAGSKLVVVLGHTECGAVKGACDGVKLGNLTSVIQALTPAVDAAHKTVKGERSSKNGELVHAATEENVKRTVAKLRTDSPVLRDLEKAGKLKIVGAMLDIATGRVTFLEG